MVDQRDTYTAQIILEAQQAIQELQVLRQNIEAYKQQILEIRKHSKESFQNIAEAIKRVPLAQGEHDVRALNTAVKELNTGAGGLTTTLGSLGTVGQFVFGTVLGITAIAALRKVLDLLKDITKAGIDFSRTIFELSSSVKLLQSLGMEITFEDSLKLVRELKEEFGIFSTKSLTEGIAKIQLLMRNFEFTNEQMKEVARLSAALAVIQGKDVSEAARELSLFFSSGYAESLQRAGFAVNRVTVAHEAQRMGLIELGQGYQALTEPQRALAAYTLVMRQAGDLTILATKAQEESFGQVNHLTAAWQDFTTIVGARAAPAIGYISELLAGFLEWALKAVTSIQELSIFINSNLAAAFLTAAASASIFWDAVRGKGLAGGFEAVLEEFRRTRDELQKEMGELAFPEFEDPLADFKGTAVDKIDEEAQELEDIVKGINEIIIEEEQEAAQRRLDIWRDYYRDLQQMAVDYGRKLVDLETDYQRELDDIDAKRSRDIADENMEYANKVAEAVRDAAYRRAEAERKYRDQELIAERRFQEKLRRLREGFLFDLEDALRERDARQVIRLTRQYAMQRGQLEREEEIDKKERRMRYQEELRDIEHQREERLRQLAVEHAQRLREIDLQAQREKERAKLEFERKKEDEALRYEQEKADRKRRLDEQLVDLDASMQERINKAAAKLLQEYDVTADGLDAIAQLYENTYGPGGRIDAAIQYYIALLQSLSKISIGIPYGGGYGATPPPAPPPTPGHQEGGTVIATKPTRVLFGEGGPEMATFTPLSRKGVNVGKVSGMIPAGMSGKSGSKSIVEIGLHPNLIASIIDKTLDETADVIINVVKTRQH